MTHVAAMRCSGCRQPLDPATAETVRVGKRVVSRLCPSCAPKARRGARALRAVALRGVGIAAQQFFPRTFAIAKTAYLTARDAWEKA